MFYNCILKFQNLKNLIHQKPKLRSPKLLDNDTACCLCNDRSISRKDKHVYSELNNLLREKLINQL